MAFNKFTRGFVSVYHISYSLIIYADTSWVR